MTILMSQLLRATQAPFVPIGDVAKCYSGATPDSTSAAFWEGGTIPWMSSGEVNRKIIDYTDKRITPSGFDSCSTKMVPPNSVVIALAGQGKTRGLVARTRIELCTNQSLCAIVPSEGLDAGFLFHYLSGQYRTLRSLSSGDGSRGGLNQQIIRSFRVPLPPVELQRQIAAKLDEFQVLEAELEAELEARRKQYAFYQSLALNSPEYLRLEPLRHITTYTRGVTYAKSEEVRDAGGGHRILRSNNIDLGGNRLNFDDVRIVNSAVRVRANQWLKRGDILISAASGSKAHVGKVAYVTEDMDYTFGGFMAVVRSHGDVLPRYLFHQLVSRRFGDYLDATIASTTINNLTGEIMGNFKIPVPALEEQQRIVDLLDSFDALVNDLSVGLPAELRARRKQYEYYRKQLLSFDEVSA